MKAITTRYRGPTDSSGSCFLAKTEGQRALRVPYNHALGIEENHEAAAVALCQKLNWSGSLVTGCLPDGKTRVHVFIGGTPTKITLPHTSLRNGEAWNKVPGNT